MTKPLKIDRSIGKAISAARDLPDGPNGFYKVWKKYQDAGWGVNSYQDGGTINEHYRTLANVIALVAKGPCLMFEVDFLNYGFLLTSKKADFLKAIKERPK